MLWRSFAVFCASTFCTGTVMSRIATQWRWLRTQVLEHKAEVSLSVRVTTAAVLSFMLSHLLSLPLPLWTMLTAIILTQVTKPWVM